MSVVEPQEELADIRAYDAAKLGPQDAVPFEKAIRDLRSELVAMPCAVDILRTAQKDLSRITRADVPALIAAICGLAEDLRR